MDIPPGARLEIDMDTALLYLEGDAVAVGEVRCGCEAVSSVDEASDRALRQVLRKDPDVLNTLHTPPLG